MVSVVASDLSIDFPLYHADSRSLKKAVLSVATSRLGKDRKQRVVVHAVRDLSFALAAGDRLGLIGENGAGKTTLLRTLAGIYEPVRGALSVRGRLTALLDLSQGINIDLTGRENIRLFALYKKLSPPEAARLEADVVAFCNLDQFIDIPMRTYSAGMTMRLGFALATAVHPEVLVMDEWLQAGDAAFLERARDRLESVVCRADILVMASHSADIVKNWCNRVIWMENGRIKADGPPDQVLQAYLPAAEWERISGQATTPALQSEGVAEPG